MIARPLAVPVAVPDRPGAVLSILVPPPAVCLAFAFVSDVVFWKTANLFWLNVSSWLLLAGLALGVIALLGGVIEALAQWRLGWNGGWLRVLAGLLVLGVAFVNNLVHATDGWTAVVPWGLALSAVTVILVIVVAWLGWADNHGEFPYA